VLMLMLMLLQMLILIEILMFNCRTFSYLDTRFCTKNCICNVLSLSSISKVVIKLVMKCSYTPSDHLRSNYCILSFDIRVMNI